MTEQDEITGMYELLEALEEALKAADPVKREALAKTIDAVPEILRRLCEYRVLTCPFRKLHTGVLMV